MALTRIEKRIRIRRQKSDDDGSAGEKKERNAKADVDGYHRERLVGERIDRGGRARPDKWRRLIRHIDPT